MNDVKREMLRHTVATLAYRGEKAIKDAPAGFGDLKVSETTRTPLEILAHIGDLLDWALSVARGRHVWNEAKPLRWDEEVERFFRALKIFDDFLASDESLGNSPEKLFQGPVADALTHVGQLALLRRIYHSPVRGENYFKAEIEKGCVGREQSATRIEFD